MAEEIMIKHIYPVDIDVSEESFISLFENRIDDLKRQHDGRLPTDLIGEWPAILKGAFCRFRSSGRHSSSLTFRFRNIREIDAFEPLVDGTADLTLKFKNPRSWHVPDAKYEPPHIKMICNDGTIDLEQLVENLKNEMMVSKLKH
jgi:hypothetical protein